MSANEEIRERRSPFAASPPVAQKRSTGKKRGVVGDRLTIDDRLRQDSIEIFNARKVNGDLGKDNRVDYEPRTVGRKLERLR